MGLFKKKEVNKQQIEETSKFPEIPKLPELPELPEFPAMDKRKLENLPKLPDFNQKSLGDKFSEYGIKEAVTGEKEVNEEIADDFAQEMQMMRKPRSKEKVNPVSYSSFEKPKEAQPLFIRIDKFEDGSKTFEQAKRQVAEIERMFNELRKVKEDEEKELATFEEKIKQIKAEIEKVDAAIFSKVN